MRWTKKELSHLNMLLETENTHSVHELARLAHERIKGRSVTAIAHKLRELISEREFVADQIELEGQVFPASVLSGYIIITLPNKQGRPAHVWLWEQHYGEVPEGYHIHHINGNRIDNRIENLALVDAGEHIKMHMSGKPPETFILFSFLQEKKLWSEYLEYRKNSKDIAKSLCTKKP